MNTQATPIKLKVCDRLTVFQASFWIPIVEIWMRRRGFQRCQQGLEKIADSLPKRGQNPSLDRAQHIAFLVDKANKRYSIYVADCLTRSLVLQYFLRRCNIEAVLQLGVRTITGQFEAHAWVEYENIPLGEEMPVRQIYTPFDRPRKHSGEPTP